MQIYSVRDTNRVEAFSDGVFTIAITLLVLEIKVPHGLPDRETLVQALLDEWPKFAAYLISFATIGMMWMSHHFLFRFIRHADNMLFYTNLLVLLLITFVPFPTALVADYLGLPGQRVAGVLYAGTFFGLSLAFLALWRHASKHRRLIAEEIPNSTLRAITRSYRLRPLFRFAAFGLAFLNVYASMALTLTLAIYFASPPNITTKGEG